MRSRRRTTTRLCIDGRFLLQDVTGVQRVAIELVRALDEMLVDGAYPGWRVEVLAPARGTLVTVPDYKAVRLRRLGRLSGHAWEQLELPFFVGRDPLLCLGNVAPVALLAAPRPRVWTMVHDLSYEYFPHAYSRAFRLAYGALVPLALARSRAVFTVSRSEEQAILRAHRRLVPPGRVVAVQNGGGEGAVTATPSQDPMSTQPGSPDVPTRALRPRRCLYVGSLTRRKNAEGLLRAALELVRTTDLEVVLVGASSTSFTEVGVDVPPDLAERVRTLGQVNDAAAVEAEYRQAAVLLFPSFYEASPLPPVEAMRFGCPVVAADIPSLRERCGDAALYCDPTDISSMVQQVVRLVDDPDTWRSCQEAGLRQAALYTWQAQARAVMERILGEI